MAQQSEAELEDSLHYLAKELKETREQLNNLLLTITKGETHSKWQEGMFEYFDLVEKEVLAGYINENFMKNGRLTVKENNDA